MINKRIVYPTNNGGISIIIPTGEIPIEIVAKKDVPTDVPYLIVSEDAIPSDRTFRDAWESDFSNPDGYGSDYGIGSTKAVIAYEEDNTPVLEERGEIQ